MVKPKRIIFIIILIAKYLMDSPIIDTFDYPQQAKKIHFESKIYFECVFLTLNVIALIVFFLFGANQIAICACLVQFFLDFCNDWEFDTGAGSAEII